jgi:hypothetical protein
MAHQVKKHSGTAKRRGLRRLATTVASHWVLVAVSHTVATIAIMVGAQLLHVSSCGR